MPKGLMSLIAARAGLAGMLLAGALLLIPAAGRAENGRPGARREGMAGAARTPFRGQTHSSVSPRSSRRDCAGGSFIMTVSLTMPGW